MFTLSSETLTVEILDPVADQERFGTRYCTGGYVFQVTDARHGPLLSGPTFPHDFNTFDGQGIPDAFNLSPLRDPDGSSTALIIGVGMCDLAANTVQEFCTWDIEQYDGGIAMTTTQSYASWALRLRRVIELHDRTLRSTITVDNTGMMPIQLRWFPHPFFPHLEGDDTLCRTNIPVGMPDNDWYVVDDSGWIKRKGWQWTEGHFQSLDHDAQQPLVIFQKHPALGLIAATCTYAPAFFPIWGNPYTFSWEPYLERTLGGGLSMTWNIDYDF